ncbi:hypothetical protein D3C72_1841840 [compost metagenome]
MITVWPALIRPNSPAALTPLIMSLPAFASTTTLALEAEAATTGLLKSLALSGCRVAPTFLPPPASTALRKSASSDWPKA